MKKFSPTLLVIPLIVLAGFLSLALGWKILGIVAITTAAVLASIYLAGTNVLARARKKGLF